MKHTEKDGYIESLKPFTDRELQELNTYHQRKSSDHLKSIDRTLIFFLNLVILSIIIGIVYFVAINS